MGGTHSKPKECVIGQVDIQYLDFHLGHWQMHPQIAKTAAIAACLRPKTIKEVRQFLGQVGYYHRL